MSEELPGKFKIYGADTKCDEVGLSATNDLLCAKKGLVGIAARLVRHKYLDALYEVCENQETITTRKLEVIINKVANELVNEGRYVRNMTNKINT